MFKRDLGIFLFIFVCFCLSFEQVLASLKTNSNRISNIPYLLEKVFVTPYKDQKPGTSGLRKKTRVFSSGTYFANFVQSIFNSFEDGYFQGTTLLICGDGRYYSKRSIQIATEIAVANGVRRVWTGVNGLCSTPAASAIIRRREGGVAVGGILLTASHNPGGINGDFGVKYNIETGSPAPEAITNRIYVNSQTLTYYKRVKLPTFKLNVKHKYDYIKDKFTFEVIDTVEDWLELQKEIFDFVKIKEFVQRKDFTMLYDAMHGVAGPYAHKLFVDEFKLPPETILHPTPLEDFGGLHPDPNLVVAEDLVEMMKVLNPDQVSNKTPDFGAAGDGDCDRNMILGKGFFVTPSDSLAVITSYAEKVIPYFGKKKLQGVARSMPTSKAVNMVATSLGINCYEVPTGWKYFGNLMDSNLISICGEESFGTGSDHIREKDGLWAVLAWLSILSYNNPNPSKPLVSVKDILIQHWTTYGRNYYVRFDYENVNSNSANEFIQSVSSFIVYPEYLSHSLVDLGLKIETVDSFTYKDITDGSITKNQGIRIIFSDKSRIIIRLSGTGSSGATIRIYLEKYDNENILQSESDALSKLYIVVKERLRLKDIIGTSEPTVIT